MRNIRLYCENLQDDSIVLDETEGHHLYKVLRLGPGDAVELFDGDGTCAEGEIETADRRGVRVRIVGRRQQAPRPNRRIILATSMPKGQRFEQVIEQATELGVDRIVPVVFERTIKQASGPSALQRYHKIAVSACKQCGRNRLPQMDLPLDLDECLSHDQGPTIRMRQCSSAASPPNQCLLRIGPCPTETLSLLSDPKAD